MQIIKDFEGLRLEAYKCPAGVWTIGYGHTKTAKEGMKVTQEQACELLRGDLRYFEEGVDRLVTVKLLEGMREALVSFSFNVGLQALESSTLLRKLNSGDYLGASTEFHRWVYAGGKRLRGLKRRREAEARLFLVGQAL